MPKSRKPSLYADLEISETFDGAQANSSTYGSRLPSAEAVFGIGGSAAGLGADD